MVHVRTDRKEVRGGVGRTLAVKGHAGFAPKGQDIVCAAVSALVQTLGCWVMENPGGKLWHNAVAAKDGGITITAAANEKDALPMEERFDLVIDGLRLLEKQYPENVAFEDDGKDTP